MITRREILLASWAMSLTAGVHDPAHLPPATKDAYGLDKALGANDPLERTLRLLGEPALLPGPDAPPVFRLLELPSFRKPRAARITFKANGEASAWMKQIGSDTDRADYDLDHGVRLRALLDDRERFWDAAPVPPDWDSIDGKAAGEVRVRGDGTAVLVEGRVGGRHHALLRHNPEADTYVGRAMGAVFF